MAETSPPAFRDTSYVATKAKVTAQQVRNWARRGLIPVVITVAAGGRREYKFPADEVDAWLAARDARAPVGSSRGSRVTQLERDLARLHAELEAERAGRRLAEQRIYALEREVAKRNAAIAALLADDQDPSEVLARARDAGL